MATRRHKFGQRISRLGALIAVGLLLLACNRATPTPQAAPAQPAVTDTPPVETSAPGTAVASNTPVVETTAPVSEATATRAVAGSVGQGAVFTSPRYSYTVELPCCWLALPTPGTAIESALAELEAESDLPLWGDLGERVRERESGAVLELIALLPDAENVALPVAQVTVSVLPAYGMTLDDYVSATEAELTGIANTSVLTAHIDPALGVGAFPASVIEYTALPNAAGAESDEAPIAGLQVAFFGHDAETLIVLTFTTTVDRFAELQPQFLHIVRTITLLGPLT